MRLTKLNSKKLVYCPIDKYRIKWDEKSPSGPQFRTKLFLKKYWQNYIVLEEFRIPGSLLRCDFINVSKNIAIEVQGKQHNEYNKFFHGKSREKYRQAILRDTRKINWLEDNGFKIIEINEDEVDKLSLKFIEEKFGILIL